VSRFRVLVAEDEPLARAMLADLLKRDAEIATVVQCAGARDVREALARQQFDIAFLDIEMPETSGLELAESTMQDGPVIVFVTAFSRYAPNAFDVNAIDYVLKPFTDERFFTALERAKTRVRERRLGELASQLGILSAELRKGEEPQGTPFLTRLSIRQGERSILLNVSEIVWIEAEDYYVLVHSKRGRHMVRAALSSLEERLDPQVFLRVHRAAIVNVAEVQEVRDEERLTLVLSDGSRVAVSRSRRRHVEPLVLPRLRSSKPSHS
jgi:two-component system, LytTR family, response regulator